MKHRIRKLTSVLLAIIMILSVLTVAPFTVSAAGTANDIVNVARGEVGVSGQPNKYTYWLGSINGSYSYAWCHAFVSWCANQAGAGDKVPKTASCATGVKWFENRGQWKSRSSGYTPKAGDIIYFDYGSNGTYDHVGIVTSSSGGRVYTIEGNARNAVKVNGGYSNGYSLSSTDILGYGTPSYASAGNNPIGCVDSITGGTGVVNVRGWAFDADDMAQYLQIHVYIGGPAGTSNVESHAITAKVTRIDVHNMYGCGYDHGFDTDIPTSKTGSQPIYIYAINIGGGENVCIGSGTVNIIKDNEPPKIKKTYLSSVTKDTYRVCCEVSDNAGISSVRIATWTQGNQSDIIWHDALFNGYGTYYIDLKRSDYSKISNSVYQNHIYVYDFAGNMDCTSIEMNYRITSDTGQIIPDGEYRIVTRVSDSKALDVNNGNVRIYSNLDDKEQTFNFQYIGDGFYNIFNSCTEMPLDVEGDTYESGTNVCVSKYHNGTNQQWMVKSANDGYYNIFAHSNGLALDLAYNKNEDGANVQVHTVNNSDAQKWKLRRVLKEDMVSVGDITINNNNEKIVPEITVTSDGKILTEGIDYSVEISADIENETGKVKIIGLGNFCDTVTSSFNINVKKPIMSGYNITLSSNSYTYDGKAKTPTVTVKNDTATLVKDTDYTVEYSNNTNAGTATVTVTGIGNYTGTLAKTFTINKAQQTVNATISSNSINVGGTSKITASGQGTINYASSNTDVATVDNTGVVTGKSAGTATITVTASGDGNYQTASITFSVVVEKADELGDVNGDGGVSIDDVTLIQKFIADVSEFSSAQKDIADVNKDGDISIDDVTLIQKYLAGIISNLG